MRNNTLLNIGLIRKEGFYSPLFLFLLALSFLVLAQGILFARDKSPKKISEIKKTSRGCVMYVYGKPFILRGVVYQPIPIGSNWQYDIFSHKEVIDVDAPMIKSLGANTVRFYQPGKNLKQTKAFIHRLYKKYGLYTIMGNWLGFWDNPNYADPDFRKKVKRSVIKMVKALKDEPGIIMWVLGNENNFSFGPENMNPWITKDLLKIRDPMKRRQKQAEIYYKFVDEIAREIKKIDGTRLVALGNGGSRGLDVAGRVCKNIDVIGVTLFTGKSFGHIWRDIKKYFPDKAFFVMEFGADSFDSLKKEENQDIQAEYIISLWREIERNLAASTGKGNVIGGIVFEWTDEWWKSEPYDPKSWYRHDKKGDWSCGGYYHDIACENNMNMNEEWWGIVSLSRRKDGRTGLNLRKPKKAYYVLQQLWTSPVLAQKEKSLAKIAD